MTFQKMKKLEPELARLELSARFAGEHGATWLDVLFATNEALTKVVGRGADREELQNAYAYEAARAALRRAWQGAPANDTEPATWPWEAGWGDGAEDFQHEVEAQYA